MIVVFTNDCGDKFVIYDVIGKTPMHTMHMRTSL